MDSITKKRIVMCVTGVVLSGVAVSFFKSAVFGVDPFQALMSGLDALIPIKDEIGYIVSTSISPTINNYLGTTLWNDVYVDGTDTAEALEEAQESIESDLF